MRITLPYNLAKAQGFELRGWLQENVGFYQRMVMGYYVGEGWRMVRRVDDGGFIWVIDIDDESLATLFILRWV